MTDSRTKARNLCSSERGLKCIAENPIFPVHVDVQTDLRLLLAHMTSCWQHIYTNRANLFKTLKIDHKYQLRHPPADVALIKLCI